MMNRNFTMLDKPISFIELYKDRDIEVIQIFMKDVGFCGAFNWDDNIVKTLDGDSYSKNMTVYGYEWFDNEKGLNLLVGDDW